MTTQDCNRKILDLMVDKMVECPGKSFMDILSSYFIPQGYEMDCTCIKSADMYSYAKSQLKPHRGRHKYTAMSMNDRTVHEANYLCATMLRDQIYRCPDMNMGQLLKNFYLKADCFVITFPNNPNSYSVSGPSKASEFIAQEYSHLSWPDKFARPISLCEEMKDTPLDNACKELDILVDKLRKSKELRQEVLEHYADAMFTELQELSEVLNLKFTSLSIYQFDETGKHGHRTIANYLDGHINFNSSFLSTNPMAVRKTLVHELCHDGIGGHGPDFVRKMEQSLIRVGMLKRSCVYAPEYVTHNPIFPLDSCRYNMHHVFKGLRAERGEGKSDHVSWKGKAYERIMRMSRILLHNN